MRTKAKMKRTMERKKTEKGERSRKRSKELFTTFGKEEDSQDQKSRCGTSLMRVSPSMTQRFQMRAGRLLCVLGFSFELVSPFQGISNFRIRSWAA